jgi:hypothetical protein
MFNALGIVHTRLPSTGTITYSGCSSTATQNPGTTLHLLGSNSSPDPATYTGLSPCPSPEGYVGEGYVTLESWLPQVKETTKPPQLQNTQCLLCDAAEIYFKKLFTGPNIKYEQSHAGILPTWWSKELSHTHERRRGVLER